MLLTSLPRLGAWETKWKWTSKVLVMAAAVAAIAPLGPTALFLDGKGAYRVFIAPVVNAVKAYQRANKH